MGTLNKVYWIIFSQVVAPISLVFGLLINVVLMDAEVLPASIADRLVWFQENSEFSSKISLVLYLFAGVMTFITVSLSISLARSKKGGEDEKVGKKIRRLAR